MCKHTDILGKYCFLGNYCDKSMSVDVGCVVHMPHNQVPPKALPSEQVLGRIKMEVCVRERDKKAWDSKLQSESLNEEVDGVATEELLGERAWELSEVLRLPQCCSGKPAW